jgi:putative hemolysin
MATVLTENLYWLAAMAVLLASSAFFSGSEAALFFLSGRDRRALRSGTRAQRLAGSLLADPDRLLSAILFWNLVINVTYFAIASIISLQLGRHPEGGQTMAWGFALVSLLTIIFFSEMLPKTIAVFTARTLAAFVSVPLALAVRMIGPVMPILRTANLLSRRLLWPSFEPETYLGVSDLERAIEISTGDAELALQEQAILQNIVSLSEIRVDEWMRPRMQFLAFRPPVSLDDLGGKVPPSEYLLITEPNSDEVASAIRLRNLTSLPKNDLQKRAEPVLYVPWCTTVAHTLQQLQTRDREVAAVVNEFGETIGIITLDDLLDTIFVEHTSRSQRMLHRDALVEKLDGVWHVTGMTTVRRLGRHFQIDLPPSRTVTVAGVLQEVLQRLPAAGDECVWGPFRFRVVETPSRGNLLIELTIADRREDSP